MNFVTTVSDVVRRSNSNLPARCRWICGRKPIAKLGVIVCEPAARLKRGGAAGHLRPVTRDDHAAHYGNFLCFLDRLGLPLHCELAAGNMTSAMLEAYIDELKGRVASTTFHGSICKLRRTARYMAPGSRSRLASRSTAKTSPWWRGPTLEIRPPGSDPVLPGSCDDFFTRSRTLPEVR